MHDRGKGLERTVARRIGGKRYPASSGGPTDCESATLVVQCKHRRRLSLAEIEAEAVRIAHVGQQQGKHGVVCIKRKAGRGTPTPLLFCMTQAVWEALQQPSGRAKWGQSGSASLDGDSTA